MAKTFEDVEELLKLVRDEDIATLRAIEQRLHSILEQKERDEAMRRRGESARDGLSERSSNVPIDPALLALVGIHPENPIQDDKTLIREIIARKISVLNPEEWLALQEVATLEAKLTPSPSP